jgi:predicted transcriptional regulator of viral defense system
MLTYKYEVKIISHMGDTTRDRVLDLARTRTILRAADIEGLGIHTQILTRLVAEGALERVGPGRYRSPAAPVTENHGLALTAAAVPRGVVCLLSALVFHGLGTQNPTDVWLAIDRRARAPRVDWPPLRIVRFSGRALTDGIETHEIEGQKVRVYSLPKTIADCFKYRNKVGLDVALEALKDAWNHRRVRMADLDEFGRVCRVGQVMRPYIETLAA